MASDSPSAFDAPATDATSCIPNTTPSLAQYLLTPGIRFPAGCLQTTPNRQAGTKQTHFGKTPLESLPNDVTRMILKHLDFPERIEFTRTSKTLARAALSSGALHFNIETITRSEIRFLLHPCYWESWDVFTEFFNPNPIFFPRGFVMYCAPCEITFGLKSTRKDLFEHCRLHASDVYEDEVGDMLFTPCMYLMIEKLCLAEMDHHKKKINLGEPRKDEHRITQTPVPDPDWCIVLPGHTQTKEHCQYNEHLPLYPDIDLPMKQGWLWRRSCLIKDL